MNGCALSGGGWWTSGDEIGSGRGGVHHRRHSGTEKRRVKETEKNFFEVCLGDSVVKVVVTTQKFSTGAATQQHKLH